MTLSPVFRSVDAVKLLHEEGILAHLQPALRSQARAVETLHGDLRALIDATFLEAAPPIPGEDATEWETLGFLQEYFFLVLFRSLFASLGIPESRLQGYAELNFCIKGTITAADNLFDEQAKRLLPLAAGEGARFLSILQLMCFERLIRRALDRMITEGETDAARADAVLKGLLDLMAKIGRLEGSEEGGVHEIPAPDAMVDRVHRVRGGALFALAFVPPAILESGPTRDRVLQAEPAVARLGTAFQIVDDLTDFEFDVGRRSHNLLVSQIHHYGSADEREALASLLSAADAGGEVPTGLVETVFVHSARAVLDRAYDEARQAFSALEALGFWFPARLADEVVHAIVGLEGVRRMAEISTPGSDAAAGST
jgi:hypothetical protein